jgi:hypothetical protein
MIDPFALHPWAFFVLCAVIAVLCGAGLIWMLFHPAPQQGGDDGE